MAWKKRNTLLKNIDLLLSCTKDAKSNDAQHALFDTKQNIALELKPTETQTPKTQELYWEKELLGAYVSGHPLSLFRREGLHIQDVKQKRK